MSELGYIAPSGVIEFFGDLGLSDNYTDTYYFSSESEKDSAFSALTPKARVSNCSYSRENKNRVRVDLPISRLYNANYMRFKNIGFENKWFYAFVKKVNYINNNCTEVEFDVDVITTWMGVFTLGDCFVERMHSSSDVIGDNITPEPLQCNEYITEFKAITNLCSNMKYVIYVISEEDGKPVGGTYQFGNYSGVSLIVCETVVEVNSVIEEYLTSNKIDNLLAIYQLPSLLANQVQFVPNTQKTVTKPYSNLGGYVPRNNKLFTYPYKFLMCDNTEGVQRRYAYEYFNRRPRDPSKPEDTTCVFKIYGYGNTPPQVVLVPYNYKTSGTSTDNIGERIEMTHFSQCSISVDAYKAYLAQYNSTVPQNIATGLLKTAVSGITGVLTGNPMAIMGAISSGAGIVNTIAEASVKNKIEPLHGDMSKGSQDGDVMQAMRTKEFTFYGQVINNEQAIQFDTFFDSYGYAQNRLMHPSMNNRPYWTYTKTIGCNVHGNLPSYDASIIEKIFDKGCRFWKGIGNIGNYSLNNSV